MAGTVKFSMSMFFKAKGGFVRHHRVGKFINFDIVLGELRCSFRTGASLAGFRKAEEIFQTYLPDGYELDGTVGSSIGLDFGFLSQNLSGNTLAEKRSALLELIAEQSSQLDQFGFVRVQREVVKGTFKQYMTDLEASFDVVVCENEVQCKRLKQLFAGASGGSWEGMEFTLPVIEPERAVDHLADLEMIFDAWRRAEWVLLKNDSSPGKQKEEEVSAVDGGSEKEPLGEEVESLLELRRKPLSLMREAERENIFWGGGSPPPVKSARDSFVRKTFPPDRPMPLSQFIDEVLKKAYTDWDLAERMVDMNYPDPRRLVIGQIIRAQGQIEFTDGGRVVKYVPRPEEWKESQRRVALCNGRS